jgi:hypothetical protein
MSKLGFACLKSVINFQIVNTEEGQIADGKDFILTDEKPVVKKGPASFPVRMPEKIDD